MDDLQISITSSIVLLGMCFGIIIGEHAGKIFSSNPIIIKIIAGFVGISSGIVVLILLYFSNEFWP